MQQSLSQITWPRPDGNMQECKEISDGPVCLYALKHTAVHCTDVCVLSDCQSHVSVQVMDPVRSVISALGS